MRETLSLISSVTRPQFSVSLAALRPLLASTSAAMQGAGVFTQVAKAFWVTETNAATVFLFLFR